MLAARDALRDDVRAAADAYGAYVVGLALAVAADFSRYASQAQRNAGALDFDDLLGRARDLLSGVHEPDKAKVVATRRHFQRRYRYLLLDEFQDTDPLQAEIAFLLAEREPTTKSWAEVELQPGKLFLVGDPKQSIYRFRRADIAMYHEVGELLRRQGGEVLTLRQNFRTVASVVGWVNGAFGDLIGARRAAGPAAGLRGAHAGAGRRRTGPQRGRGRGARRGRTRHRRPGAPAEPGRPLPPRSRPHRRPAHRPRAPGLARARRQAAARRLARRAAGRRRHPAAHLHLRRLLRAGAARGRPAVPGRRRPHVLQPPRGARHPGRAPGARHGRRPRGRLLAPCTDSSSPSPTTTSTSSTPPAEPSTTSAPLPPAGFPEIVAALADLRALHEQRNLRPPAETLDDLVRRTGLLESLALWADDPDQAIGNIAELVSLADEFAQSAEATFHAFVAKTAHDVSAADTAESPVGEPGAFVRLMTVHKAKGLEFPIVVLAGAMRAARSASRDPLVDRGARRLDCALTCPSPDPGKPGATVRLQTAGYEPRFALEKQALEHERVRLLYVALTRAADLLVLPIVTADPGAGSLQSLWQATLPEGVVAAAVANPATSEGGEAPDGAFADAPRDDAPFDEPSAKPPTVRPLRALRRRRSCRCAPPRRRRRRRVPACREVAAARRRPRGPRRARRPAPTRCPCARRGARSAPRSSRGPRAPRRSSRRAPWSVSKRPTGATASALRRRRPPLRRRALRRP